MTGGGFVTLRPLWGIIAFNAHGLVSKLHGWHPPR